MTNTIDLNSDLGEGFGPWKMGDDAAIMEVVSSVNVACGFHAGDPNVMARTMALAVEKDLGIGAHPGFDDLMGFGRRRMHISTDELTNLIAYQVGAAQAMARLAGGHVRHMKLHGALGNMASEDASIARTCYEAALKVQPDIILMAISATAMEQAARELDCHWVGEIYADRAYEDDGTLVDRRKPGAVLHDPVEVSTRVAAMIREQAITSVNGKKIPCKIDTVCLHGDTDGATELARGIKANLTAAGLEIRRFG